MYRVGPTTTAHVTPVQYRHTSFLRGLDSLDNEDKDTTEHYRSLAAKPRTLLSASTRYDSGEFSRSPPITPALAQSMPEDSETPATTTTASTTPMAAASIIDVGVSSMREGGLDDGKDVALRSERSGTVLSSPRSMDLKRRADAWADDSRNAPAIALGAIGNGSGDEESAIKRNGDRDGENHAGDQRRSYDRDESGGNNAKLIRGGERDRLPGIAHLDRHMPKPWSSGGVDGSVQQYRRGTEVDDSRAAPSRWASPFSSIRRGESFGGEDNSLQHHATSRYADHSPRYSHGQPFGLESSSRLPSYAPSYTPYKRSGSPLQATHREREGSESDYNRRRYSSVQSMAQQPVSPGSRRRSPHDSADAAAPPLRASEYPPTWHEASRHHANLPPRSSYPPFPGPYDDRPTLPHLPARSGSVSGASRNEAYYSPPPSMHSSMNARRLHGDSTSSGGSSGEHAVGYRPVAGMPRGSVSSLRSLSMPYPYEGGAAPHERAYPDAGYYDDMGRPARHHGEQPHDASAHSSPRHHPYGIHGGAGAGSSSVDAYAGASPPSMPRRRGKLPKPVTDLLKTWLLDHAAHPYPTEDEKRRLCAATNLSISQVSNWFINARRRILIPQGSGQFGVTAGASGVSSGTGATKQIVGGGGGSAMSTPHQSPGPGLHLSHHHPHQYQAHDEAMPRDVHKVYPDSAAADARHGHHGMSALPPPPQRTQASSYGPPPPELPSPHYGAGSIHQTHAYRAQNKIARAPPGAHFHNHDYRYPRSAEQSPHIALARDSP